MTMRSFLSVAALIWLALAVPAQAQVNCALSIDAANKVTGICQALPQAPPPPSPPQPPSPPPAAAIQAPGPSLALFNAPYYSCVRNSYVATNGNDANNGSSGSPWRTLQHADAASPGAGTCINVAPGTYDGVKVTNGGNAATATGYVVYRCQALDACTINGNAGHNGNAAVDFDFSHVTATMPNTVNYVQFDGFVLQGLSLATQGPWGVGFNVWNGDNSNKVASHHVWLLNSIVKGFSQAGVAFAAADYFYSLHNTSFGNANATCDAQGSGLGLNIGHPVPGYVPSADDVTNPNPLIGTWQRGDGQFFHTVFEWNVARTNALTQCGTAANPYDTDGNGIILDTNTLVGGNSVDYPFPILVAFNVTYNNGGGGVHVYLTAHATVANNSCFNNYIDPFNKGGGGCIDDSNGYDNTYLSNIAVAVPGAHATCAYNVVPYNMWNSAILGSPNAAPLDVFSHNITNSIGHGAPGCYSEIALFDHVAGSTEVYSATDNKMTIDPGWVDVGTTAVGTDTVPPTGSNFALKPGSPAIGYGLTRPFLPPQSVDAGACHHTLMTCP